MGEKKCILIAMDTMLCGGIEKSLISLLNVLDSKKVDVTLLLDTRTGLFLDFIPQWINVVEINYNPLVREEKTIGRKQQLMRLIKKGRIGTAIKLYVLQNRECKLKGDVRRISRARRYFGGISRQEEFDNEYDLAIAYANLEQHILVAEKVRAKKKIAFFHTQLNPQREDLSIYEEILRNFDGLFCVSKDLEKSLRETLPEFDSRICFYPHILSVEMMKSWANYYEPQWPGDGIKILSVGRLAHQKGFDLIPGIAKQLAADGINFQWIIMGDGSEKNKLEESIASQSLADKIFLKEANANPYPYFSSCDIYVQPSRYEGYCLTLAEARAFAKPIISTYFDGSREQLENGKYGVLVDFGEEAIYKALKRLIASPALRREYAAKLQQQSISNTDGVKMIMNEFN